jgi:hypothetical protein
MKIDGTWREFEDWTNEPYKQFCFDKKVERIEELLIIVSNSEANRGAEVPFRIPKDSPMQVTTSNVGCWRWEGTASLTTNYFSGQVEVASATATTFDRFRFPWTNPEDVIGFDAFKSANAGTASISISGFVAGCAVSGTASGPLQGDGQLLADGGFVLNFLHPDPRLNRIAIGGGSTNIPAVTETLHCNPPETITIPRDVNWLSWPEEGVPVSADGQTISGRWERTDSEGAKTSVWNFRSVREQ